VRTLALWALLLLASAAPLAAQAEARLRERLDPATHAAVTAILARARAAGLPERPLAQKALEGVTKGAAPAEVLAAVRGLEERLAVARDALGPAAAERELVAASSALYAGATPAMLRAVRRLPAAGDELSGAYTALAFLLHRGVAPAISAEVISTLVRSHAQEAEFLSLQQLVDSDIYRGSSAADAARTRARALSSAIAGRAGSAP
jgi:hypothetical protein